MHQHALEGAIEFFCLKSFFKYTEFPHTLFIFLCRHKTKEARDICTSIKFLMLHVRDCPGTTSTYDICPYPWCRKTKHLLYHLVSCLEPDKCKICTPEFLSPQMKQLRGLNRFRRKKQQECIKIPATTSSTNGKTSTKPASTTSNRINQGLRKKMASNPTTQKVKGHPGQTPTLTIPKVSHINKNPSLSVPSPIPTGINVTKVKHPGATQNVDPKVIAHNISRQPNRAHLKIAKPANPLLPAASSVTPKTQNPIKSTAPPPTANPLLKQEPRVLNIPSTNSTRTFASNNTASATINHKRKLPATITASNQPPQTKIEPGEKTNPIFVNKTTGVAQNQKIPLNKNKPTMTSSVKGMVENNETKRNDFVAPNDVGVISSVDNNASQQMTQQQPMERTKSETLLQVGY